MVPARKQDRDQPHERRQHDSCQLGRHKHGTRPPGLTPGRLRGRAGLWRGWDRSGRARAPTENPQPRTTAPTSAAGSGRLEVVGVVIAATITTPNNGANVGGWKWSGL